MTAEKVVKINSDYELKALNERLSVYESIIDYAVAEQMLSLKNKVKDLEDEAIALRAADAEKDKMIEEKDNQLSYIRKNFDNQLNSRLEWQRKQFEAEKTQSLSDQRKNIRSREVKPEKEKVEQAKQEVDRIQKMYDSLLGEFNQVNEKLDTQNEKLDTQTGLLYTILDILNTSNSIDEAKDEIDDAITETKTALGIKYTDNRKPTSEEKIQLENEILELYNNGMSNKEIALKLFNDNNIWFVGMQSKNAMEQKVGRYLRSAKKRLNITYEKASKNDDYKYEKSLLTNELREKIRKRDNYTCQICGNSIFKEPNLLLEVDHIIPLASGGKTTEDNLQLLCWKCNRHKGKSNKITSN